MRAVRISALASLLLLTLLLGACLPLPAAVGRNGQASSASVFPLAFPQPSLVSDRGSGLVGQVLAPASLVANHSGSLVSDRGSGLVSDRGSGFANVQSLPAEVPLAGATVHLEQADGTPVLDGSGKPLEAVTDASGRYRFEATLPFSNLVLSVQLPEASGSLRGLAIRDDLREGVRQGAVDLSSTLLTTYVRDRYLLGDAEAQKRLDRLNPSIVEETRSAVRQGLGQLTEAFPDVSVPRLLGAVTRLRGQDTRIEERFEALHRLLIDAGQSDRGNGRLADTVALRYSTGLAVDARGNVHYWSSEKRLWKVTADGYLEARLDALDSLPESPSEWPSGQVRELPYRHQCVLDDEGRVVFVYKRWLLRREPDGTLTRLAEDPERIQNRTLATTPDGRIWIIDPRSDGIRLHSWRADQGLVEHPTAPTVPPANLVQAAGTAGGHLLLYVSRADHWDRDLLEFDPTSGQWTERPVEGAFMHAPPGAHMDARGNLFFLQQHQLWLLREGTRTPEYLAPWDPTVALPEAELSPDGRQVFACGERQIYRVVQGRLIRIAGLESADQSGDQGSTDLALAEPRALAIHTDGTRFVWDEVRNRLFRFVPGGRVDTVDMGELAARIGWDRVRTIRVGRDGVPLVCRGWQILVPGLPGSAIVRYQAQADIADFALDEGGNLVVSERLAPRSPHFKVVRISPSGTRTDLFTTDLDLEYTCLEPGPDGSITLCGDGRLRHWTPATGLVTLGQKQEFVSGQRGEFLRNLVVRPDGVLFGTQGQIEETDLIGFPYTDTTEPCNVWRFDPTSGEFRVLAGLKGALFNGVGVDDGLKDPCSPAFSPEGDLLFIDRKNMQVKRIPRDRLDTTGRSDLSLVAPRALAIRADGTRHVWDEMRHRLFRITPGGRMTALYLGELGTFPIRTIRMDRDGVPLLHVGSQILAPAATGSTDVLYDTPTDLADFDLDDAGNLILCERQTAGSTGFRVVRLGRSGQRDDLFTTAINLSSSNLAVAPDGSLYFCGDGRLRRWTSATGLVTLSTGSIYVSGHDVFVRNLVVRADGAVFGTQGQIDDGDLPNGLPYTGEADPASVWRFDPSTRRLKVLAGKKGPLLNGTGAEDALVDPCNPVFGPEGDLWFIDRKTERIGRIPRAGLD